MRVPELFARLRPAPQTHRPWVLRQIRATVAREGAPRTQIAARDGVAVSTVRSQVKAVFAKTGSSRQSQLAALLAAQPRIPLQAPNISEESD
jgi:DNA-binding CsgD family transcriptional regulator